MSEPKLGAPCGESAPTSEAFAELSHFRIHSPSVRLLSEPFCRKRHVVVLGEVDASTAAHVVIGVLDPADAALVRLVSETLGRLVRPVRLNEFEIGRALDVGFGRVSPDVLGTRVPLAAITTFSFEPNLAVPRAVNELLGHAVTVGASDIHVECYESDVDVRLRIDGVLHQLSTPISRANVNEAVARLKILAELDIAERGIAQDGRIMASISAREGTRAIDFRVSVVPGPFGEDCVLRILDSKPIRGFDSLGLGGSTLERFRTLIRNPEGMVFVTGPTGSGKTTTLYSALAEINTGDNKVLTVEDPIEYQLGKANQKQVSVKMNFAAFARAFMRQDPDILLIGEIRDEETADIAVRAAQTGHLVLSTMHTNGSVGTISRLGVFGVSNGLIADTMLGALSQRLVRRVCLACREPAEPNDFERDILAKLGEDFPLVRGKGCTECRQTGYRGRVGLYELFEVDEEVSDLIARGTPAFEIRRFTRSRGMRSLFDDALDKLRAGETTFDEVRLRVPYRMMLERAEGSTGE